MIQVLILKRCGEANERRDEEFLSEHIECEMFVGTLYGDAQQEI